MECVSDVGCCVKPPKTIGDSQQTIRFLLAHACAFCGAGMVLALMDYYILMYDTYFAWLPPDLIIRVGLEAAAWSFC